MTVWPGILLLVSSLSAAICSVSLAFGSSLLEFYAGLMRRVWGLSISPVSVAFLSCLDQILGVAYFAVQS